MQFGIDKTMIQTEQKIAYETYFYIYTDRNNASYNLWSSDYFYNKYTKYIGLWNCVSEHDGWSAGYTAPGKG